MGPHRAISPTADSGTVYLVLDDFGPFGLAYRETDVGAADRQTIVANLLSGQYERPLRIVAFNTREGWARDVTADVIREIEANIHRGDEVSQALCDFLDRVAPPCWSGLGLGAAMGGEP